MRRLLLPIIAAFCLGARLLPGQAHVPLLGVYDARSGEPIAGAVVRDTLGTEAVTTKDGVVALNFISPVGPFYLIEVRKPGYRPTR